MHASEVATSLAQRCILFLELRDFTAEAIAWIPGPPYIIDADSVYMATIIRDRLKKLFRVHSFFECAVQQWAYHLREAEISEPVHEMVGILKPAIQRYQNNITLRAYWFIKIIRLTEEPLDLIDFKAPPTVFCAYNGHTMLIKHLLNKPADMQANHDHRITPIGLSALHVAVMGRQYRTIEWLLD